jgi:hypothetical protein
VNGGFVTAERIGLGDGHWLRYVSWGPDRVLNPQYAELPDVEKWGAIVGHPLRPGDAQCTWLGECQGSVTFDATVQRQLEAGPFWQVESWEPLTLSPSLLCHCGDHGFIRDGHWVSS